MTEPPSKLPPRRLEPFRLIKSGEPVSIEGLAARVAAMAEQVSTVHGRQSQIALMVDGLVTTVNTRFDVFHEELALLRATVTEDHGPRLDAVEKTASQKAKGVALFTGKWAGAGTLVALAARAVAKAYPEFGELIRAALAFIGL